MTSTYFDRKFCYVQELLCKEHLLLDWLVWWTWHNQTPFDIRLCVCEWHV